MIRIAILGEGAARPTGATATATAAGVLLALMVAAGAPLAAQSAGDGARKQRLTTVADALFAFDKATLNPDAEQTPSVLGPEIAKLGQHPTVIEGHTDSIGTDAHNQRLSEQRAAAVRAWLAAQHFVAATTPIRGRRFDPPDRWKPPSRSSTL